MNRVAESLVEAERRLGHDSLLCHVFDDTDWEATLDADVHVAHTWFPELYKGKNFRRQLTRPARIVWVGHGTPEFVFMDTVEVMKRGGYGHGDGIMLMQHWLREAHARVTFWDRHAAIYETMVDRGTKIHNFPLGVDRAFWSGGSSKGKWAGTPSVWSGENPHVIKFPLDLVTTWRWVYPEFDGACLHLCYLAQDLHRAFAPWMNATGASYGMHWSALTFAHQTLRDIFKSIDFFIGLVRYGDHNRLCLEANAAGATTISYVGNPYSDFWLPEGDQRMVALALVRILKGEIPPREKLTVPDVSETAANMVKVYESIC